MTILYPSVLRWAISRAFLCGVCMFSPCSQGVSSNKNPNRKTCKKNRTILSVPDRDARFTWSPGAEKLPTAPGGSWRKDSPGWEKAENKFTTTSGLPACVCPVSPPYMHVCVPVCRVCHYKPDKGLNYNYTFIDWILL